MAEPLPPISPAQVVTLRALAITLTRVSLTVVAIGFVACLDAITRAFFGTAEGLIAWIPFAGRVLTQPLKSIQHKTSNFLGGLEEHIDRSMGWYLHSLADAVGRLADGEAEAGWVSWLLAKAIGVTRRAVHALPSTGSVVNSTTKVVKQTKVIVQRVVHVTKIATHAAPGVIARQAQALAGELGHVIEWDLPSLRTRARKLEDRLGRLEHRIRVGAKPLIGAAAVALVVAALARIGLNWIRCSNVKKAGRRICGMDASLLESLLADTVAIVGTVSLIEFIRDAQAIENVALDALGGFIREFPKV